MPVALREGPWRQIDNFLVARGIRISTPTPGSTWPHTNTGHVPDSNHYKGLARDYGCSGSDCAAIYAALEPFARSGILSELYYGSRQWSKGRPISNARITATHLGHVHAALAPGASLGPGGAPAAVSAPVGADLSGALRSQIRPGTGRRIGQVVIGAGTVGVGAYFLTRELR